MEGVVLEDVTDILALYEALETRERTDRLNAAADSTLFCQSDRRPMHVGFCGHYKSGKSSLINAMRGKRNCNAGAAKADIVECTTKTEGYLWVDNISFYDVPGSGTMACPAKDYIIKQDLWRYDCLVVMIQGSLGEDEVGVARFCDRLGADIIFVRSKCDQDLHNQYEEGEITAKDSTAAKQLVEKLTQVHREKIRAAAPVLATAPFFCVSESSMYNFVKGTNSGGVSFQEREFIIKLSDLEARGRRRRSGF